MIAIEKLRRWERNDYDRELNMIVIGFDPEMKEQYIRDGGFDIDCKISNKMEFVSILSKIVEKHIGTRFTVKLKNEKFSWFPDWVKEEFDDNSMVENYLDNIKWESNKYFGCYYIDNIKYFFTVFIDYPLKYEYQDIEMFSINSNYVVVVSHHGTVWIISEEYEPLKEIAQILDENNASVFPRRYLEPAKP